MGRTTLLELLRSESPQITVGVLTADMMALGSQLELMERASVKLLHFDVMDGCFCPLMTMGPPFIKAVKTPLLKDVHLMIDDPLPKLAAFAAAGADVLTVNVEACTHLHRALQMVGEMENANDPARGILRGVSLNPATSVDIIKPVMDQVEMVLLLAVNPGWSGQRFISSIREKIARVKELIAETGKDVLLCVDGGVKKDNVADVAAMGADIIVTGSAVFDGKAPLENARFMMEAVKNSKGKGTEKAADE